MKTIVLTMTLLATQAVAPQHRAVRPQNTPIVPTCADYKLWYEQDRQTLYDRPNENVSRFADMQITRYPDGSLIGPGELMEILSKHRGQLGIDSISYSTGSPKHLPLNELMYPQYFENFTLSKEDWAELQRRAKAQLENTPYAHPDVIAHWKSIAAGAPPFGLKVR